MANAQLAKKSGVFTALFTKPIVIAVDGRITKATLAAYLPISRAVGGKLAIFDFTPDIKYLATNAQTFALEIAKWLGMTWVEATPTVPGHWERLRAGQVPRLPSPPVPTAPAPSLCPAPAQATSQGCLWPSGTIAAFHKGRRKYRIAIPAGLQPGGRATDIASRIAAKRPASYGFGWYGLGAAYVVVAESDKVPMGAKEVSEEDFAVAAGEAPTPGPQPTVPPPPPIVTAPPPPQAAPPATPPVRVDVGPTVVEPVTPGTIVPGVAVGKPRYAGCIARFNKTRKVFSIYCPINSPAGTPGLGISDDEFRCLYGNCGLGADDVTPPVPAGFTKTAEVKTLPGAGETPAGDEREKFFRASNPVMWIAIVGTAAAVGGGGYYFMRRRKRA